MTELSSVLHASIDHPLAPPAPVEAMVARSQQLRARRRRIYAGSATLAVVLALGPVILRDGSSPTTVSLTGRGTQSAGYVAIHPGGYEGAGTWRLTIVRDGRTLEYSSQTNQLCEPIGTIQPGDHVRGEIHGDDSWLRVGESAHC